MTVTSVVLPEKARLAALTAYVKMLSDGGESVVLVTAHDPVPELRARLARAQVDPHRVAVMDARQAGPDGSPEGHHLMAAPTLVELVAQQVQRIAKAHGKPHVVVSDCEGLGDHASAQGIGEYLRYVVEHARPRLPLDLVRAEPSRLDGQVQDALHRLVPNETRIPLGPAAA